MWVTGVFPWRQSELRANFSSAPADVNCCSSQMHCSLLLGFSERLLVRATSSHNDLKCKYMNHWLILLSNEYNHLHIWTCALDMYGDDEVFTVDLENTSHLSVPHLYPAEHPSTEHTPLTPANTSKL